MSDMWTSAANARHNSEFFTFRVQGEAFYYQRCMNLFRNEVLGTKAF